MKSGPLIYAAICVAALAYLAYANLHGFVPFASSAATANRSASTAGRYHK